MHSGVEGGPEGEKAEWKQISETWCSFFKTINSILPPIRSCISDSGKNEMMPFAATWVDLEIIILSEVRQRKTSII